MSEMDYNNSDNKAAIGDRAASFPGSKPHHCNQKTCTPTLFVKKHRESEGCEGRLTRIHIVIFCAAVFNNKLSAEAAGIGHLR